MFSWLGRAQLFLCLLKYTKDGQRFPFCYNLAHTLSSLPPAVLVFAAQVSCSSKSLSIFPPEDSPSCSSDPPDILCGQEQGVFTPPLRPSCPWVCPLLCPHSSFAQGHPKHFPHPSLTPFFLLSSEPFPSSPLLVQLLAVKILALLMSWMWLPSCKAAF